MLAMSLLALGGLDHTLESVSSALFAPELSANEIQAFLMREESAHVYKLCCSVALLFAKLPLMEVHKQSQQSYLFLHIYENLRL